MGRAAPGPGQIMVVVDADDSVEFARRWRRPTAVLVGSLVHTNPKQHRAGRLQTEVPGALGKRWDGMPRWRSWCRYGCARTCPRADCAARP